MEIERGRIERGDLVFASVCVAGETVAELSDCHSSSFDDLMGRLSRLAARFTGMARIYIRNRTRGWAMQLPLLLCRPSLSLCGHRQSQEGGLCDKYGQLSIQFQ